jgi:hypothetical protein
MCLDDSAQIDLAWLWKFSCSGINVENLSGADHGRFAWIIIQRKTRVAFQNEQAIETNRLRFHNHRGPSYSNRNSLGYDLSRTGIFSRVKKDRAAVQMNSSASLVKTEDRVRSKPRNRQVLKGQFGA